jgi:hypothetical protein
VIPHVFRRIWFGPRPMPARYEQYGRSWTDLNAGWELVDHGYGDLPAPMRNQPQFDAVPVRNPDPGGGKRDSVVQVQQADIASYELLWAHGGVYLNCDMEAVRPLSGLLDGVSCAVAWEMDGEFPSNAWMAATPRHPFLEVVIDLLPQRFTQFSLGPINEQTGPHLLKQALREYQGGAVVVFPSKLFMPFDFNHLDEAAREHPDAYALHHWGHRIPDTELWGDL